MTPRQWLALFFFYISYLLFGASIFYHIEREIEIRKIGEDLQHRIDVNEILVKYTDPQYHHEIMRIVGDYCGKPVTNYTEDVKPVPLTWSFYHAFFFSFTVCSTVGYGNISPSSTLGRMIMIFYALIGIPINGFLFAYLGDFFAKVFVTAYDRYKAYKLATNKHYMPQQLGLIAQIVLYLIPGIVIFLFLPSLIFSYFEDWPYSAAIYYSFVTLSTIGFGDLVPTFGKHQEEQFGAMFYVYEIFIIFWFIFGLGYLVMIMGFIAKGLRSKHLARLEHQLSENIKATQSRIWHGVTKDVSYLRRILNEVYLMKFKGSDDIDEEEEECGHMQRRTSSCPDLTIYRTTSDPVRKRAQSLFQHVDDNEPDFLSQMRHMHRVQSDSDLTKVGRNQVFARQQIQPTELLARVFTALGNIKAADDEVQSLATISGGINGFSDSQILASERRNDSIWSIPFADTSFSVPPPKARGRAASDFRAPVFGELDINNAHDWTWSGNNQQIEEFMRLRKMNKKKQPDLYRAALAPPKNDNSFVLNVDDEAEPKPSARARSQSIFDRWNPFKKRDDSGKVSLTPDRLEVKNYLDQTSAGRHSRMTAHSTPAIKRRTSNFSILSATDESSADVLENTTIADLIRALEVMHTQAVTGDNPVLEDLLESPRSRGGSMSVTQNTAPALPLINIFPPQTPNPMRGRRNTMRSLTATNTPLFHHGGRRRSAVVDLPSRRSSLLAPPWSGPPPYSEATPRTTHRRFSVRPTLLSIPPGQSPMPSIQATSSLQRRLSTRPTTLLTEHSHLRSPRFGRSISANSSYHSTPPLDASPVAGHNQLLTPVDETQFNFPRNRQTNRPHLFNTNINAKRKRSESK